MSGLTPESQPTSTQTPSTQQTPSPQELLEEIRRRVEELRELDGRVGEWVEALDKISALLRGGSVVLDVHLDLDPNNSTIYYIKLSHTAVLDTLYIPLSELKYEKVKMLVLERLDSLLAKLLEDLAKYIQEKRNVEELIERFESYDP